MSFCFFWFHINNKVYLTDDNTKYYIPKSAPTDKDFYIANKSWTEIISLSAAGYKHAKLTNAIGYGVSPISFFYDTFFYNWKNKNSNAVNDIYRNNIKIQSSSMIAMISFILSSNNASNKTWSNIIEHHKKMGVENDHLFLMGDVLIQTILTVLKETDINNEVVLAWRTIISYSIDKMQQTILSSLYSGKVSRSRSDSPKVSPKITPAQSPRNAPSSTQSNLFNAQNKQENNSALLSLVQNNL